MPLKKLKKRVQGFIDEPVRGFEAVGGAIEDRAGKVVRGFPAAADAAGDWALAALRGLSDATAVGFTPELPETYADDDPLAPIAPMYHAKDNSPVEIAKEEASRPANYIPGVPALRGLSFARKAPAAVRAGLEVAAASGGHKAASETAERTDNPLLIAGAGIAGGVGTGVGLARAPRIARATNAAAIRRAASEAAPRAPAAAPIRGAVDDVAEAATRVADDADDSITYMHGGLGTVGGHSPLPSPVTAKVNQAPEAGSRVGTLLRPRGLDQLGSTANVSRVIGVANDLRRQVGSQVVSLEAEARNLFDVLGPTIKDARGNVRMRNVVGPDGNPALLQDVVERPARYVLSPEQNGAVTRLQQMAHDVHEEPRIFGAEMHDTPLDVGQFYFPRMANADTKGNILTRPFSGGAGKRLRTMREDSRELTDADDAVKKGVVYADPYEAFQKYVRTNLEGAANQHIAEMFKSFGATAKTRIPDALRNRHDALAKSLVSVKSTLGRVDSRLENVVDSYLRAPFPDLNALYADLQDIKVGRNAVGVAGPNFGKTAPELRREINRIQQQIQALRPSYKAVLKASIPPGRAAVNKEAASALIGWDFAEKDARRISRFYSRGILPENTFGDVFRVIGAVNRQIIPMRAIGDASATLRQLALVLPSHPIAFARNFARAGRDLFPGGQRRYNEWLSSPEVRDAAAHGVSLVGDGGNLTSDFFATWIERVPFLKQTQKHFQMIGNRNRVSLYRQDLDMLQRTGQQVDELVQEQVARNANRITGVSNIRASDVETAMEFAPNYLRSKLETLSYALTNGSIEGQLARQYLKNYVSTGLMLVAGVAIAQKRDLREVLSPFDTYETRAGRKGFGLNPNFATVRFAGQDTSIFGAYQDLARMSTIAADGVYGAITERDVAHLVQGIWEAAEAKASPFAGTGRDIGAAVLGNRVFGRDPRSWSFWLTNYIPINASIAVEDTVEKDVPWSTEGVVQGLQFLGASSNPMTEREMGGDSSAPGPVRRPVPSRVPQRRSPQRRTPQRRAPLR